MKKLIFAVLTLALATFVISAQERQIAGNWLGTLDVGGMKVRLVLKVAKGSGGGYTAKLDSIDQGAKDLAIDAITLAGDKVSLSAANLGMSYEGILNKDATEIDGTLKQGGAAGPLRFSRVAEVAMKKRPQDPVKPYAYAEEEVSYENTADKIKLAGTLTFPRGGGRFPAVLLITGSGSQDRDETISGHRPFLVLADHLTRNGFAVLRVDDRGIGGSGGNPMTATTQDYARDVEAGLAYLKTRKEIDPKQIGLIGHSEGAIIAPMVASRSKDVAFIVMLAGTGQTGKDVILTQLGLIQRASGVNEEGVKKAVAFQDKLLSIIISEPDNKRAGEKIGAMLAQEKSGLSEAEAKEFARAEADIKAQTAALLSPWYRSFISYDPRPALEKVKVPVLALNGESDLQVPSKENLAAISAALQKAGNKDVTVRSFPRLNHLFQTARTGLMSEYGEIDETISPGVLEAVTTWLRGHTRPAS